MDNCRVASAPQPQAVSNGESTVQRLYFASQGLRVGAAACAGVVILLGMLALMGRLTGHFVLGSFIPGAKAMVPAAAFSLLLLGVAQLRAALQPTVSGLLLRWAGWLAIILAALRLFEYIAGADWDVSSLFLSRWFPRSPDAHYSIPGAVLIAGVALCSILYSRPHTRRPVFGLALLTGALSAPLLLGYAYGRTVFSGTALSPVALPGALSLVFASAAFVLLAAAWQRAIERLADEHQAQDAAQLEALAQALQAERQRLYSVLDNMPGYVCLIDSKYEYRYTNGHFVEFFGQPAPGQKCHDLVLGRQQPCENCRAFEPLRDGQPVEYDWQKPDGTILHIWNFRFEDADGEVMSLETGIDVTATRRAEAELKQAQEQAQRRAEELDTIINSIADGVMIYDADGNLVRTNPAMSRLLQYTDEQRRAPVAERMRRLDLRKPDRTRVAFDDLPVTRVLRGETVLAYPMIMYPDTERESSAVYSGAPLRDAAGAITGAVIIVTDLTELRRTEQELRRSEQRLNRAQEIAHLGSWELDLLTDELTWSDEVYRIFGLQPQEFGATYEAFLERVHPDDREAVNEAYVGSLREGRDAYEIEHRVVRGANGEVRIVHERCEHMRDAEGRVVRSVGMVHDVTERKRAEEALRESERRYRSLFEGMLEGYAYHVLVRDEQGQPVDFRYLAVNPAFEPLTGYRDVVGRTLSEVVPGIWDVEPGLFERYCRVAISGEAHSWEFYFSPNERWYSVGIYQTEPDHFAAVFTDVTERKQAEEELRRHRDHLQELVREQTMELLDSERKYRELVEAANSVILKWDAQGTIVLANPYAHQLFGYEPGEMVGQPATIILPERDSQGQNLKAINDAILADPEGWLYSENENITKDGRRLWLVWTNRVICGADGQFEAMMSIGADRTAQHEAEQALVSYRDQLRQLAAELSLAEQRERHRVSTLLHDEVAQPLGAIKLHLSMLHRAHAELREELAPVVALSDDAVKQVRSIMTELSPPVLQKMGLIEAVRWWAALVEERHHLRVQVEAPAATLQMEKAQEVAIFQAIKELLQNAVKHAQAQTVHVTLDCDDDHLLVCVSDDGVGFDAQAVQTSDSGGFGLFGLHERITYMGGSVDLCSEPERGTSVTMRLPGVCRLPLER